MVIQLPTLKLPFDSVFVIIATSSEVHLRSTLLHSPDWSSQPFPLSVQYQLVTQSAPRGGLKPALAHRFW